MRYISEKEYSEELKRVKRDNMSKLRWDALKQEKNKYKKIKKKPTTSKLILLAVILLSIEIVIFVEFAMLKWGDFSAAYALIGIPATLIPTIWAYYSKSKAENTQGGIVYETAIHGQQVDDEELDEEPLG